jgi:hypothetical protein
MTAMSSPENQLNGLKARFESLLTKHQMQQQAAVQSTSI